MYLVLINMVCAQNSNYNVDLMICGSEVLYLSQCSVINKEDDVLQVTDVGVDYHNSDMIHSIL